MLRPDPERHISSRDIVPYHLLHIVRAHNTFEYISSPYIMIMGSSRAIFAAVGAVVILCVFVLPSPVCRINFYSRDVIVACPAAQVFVLDSAAWILCITSLHADFLTVCLSSSASPCSPPLTKLGLIAASPSPPVSLIPLPCCFPVVHSFVK